MGRYERKNLFIDSEVYRMLKAYAVMKGRPIGEVLEEALKMFLDKKGFGVGVER